MKIRFAKPLVTDGDISAVAGTLKNTRQMTNGGAVRAFETAFSDMAGGGMAVAVSSCTAALYMTLMALGVKRGDQVILPALTFAACAHAIEAVGAEPVFVDSEPTAGTMDPEKVESAITRSTKVIMAMHYAGRVCYMGTLKDVARRHNVQIMEDCATAIGAVHSEKHVGLLGAAGCFSFHPVKHITAGEGGMILTTHPEIAEKVKLLREFGKIVDVYNPISGNYSIEKFGLNFRMTEMQGALGLSQLKRLPEILKRRGDNLFFLKTALSGFEILDPEPGAYYALIVMLPEGVDQYTVRNEMVKQYVETSLYYPGPLPLMPYFAKKYGHVAGAFPVAERIATQSVALSVGPHLGKDDMLYQASVFKKLVRKLAA